MDSPLEAICGQKSDCQSAFRRALDKYIDSLPENNHKKKFIAACYDSSSPVTTSQSVLESFKKIEATQSKKSSVLSKVIKKVVSALVDYDDIVKTLASADPMPTAIIWGSLSVVINGAQRYYNLFDTIKDELRDLATQIERVAEYEELFGDCPKLQRLFCDSYINMLRFWNRIYKELTKPVHKSLASAAFSSCSSKLGDIIKEMQNDAKKMQERANILSEQKLKKDRENFDRERDAQSDWRKQQEDEEMKRTAFGLLQSERVRSANINRLEEIKSQRMDGTCDWVIKRSEYIAWRSRMTDSPVCLLYAPPGSGKSTLCSRIIQSIQEPDYAIALVYHFYRFDETFKAVEVLKHFAHQLLKKYLDSGYSMDVLKKLVDRASLGDGIGLQCMEEIITLLVQHLSGVYFVLDGLDEESAADIERWSEAEKVLDLLLVLAKEYPRIVRVWSSSQRVARVRDKFKVYSSMDVMDEMRNDIAFYLSREVNKLDLSDDDKQSILHNLKDRAAGIFLWAKLIVRDLEDANSPADIRRIVEEGPTLDDYYRRFFERIEVKDRSLACYAFALVAFARRPLKRKELREAIGMLRSRDAGSDEQSALSLNRAEMPYMKSLLKLIAPLIEVESDCDVVENCICRLYHSTVLDFLHRNSHVLSNGPTASRRELRAGLKINSNIIADGCLLYLFQPRYSRLLTRESDSGQWLDLNNDPVAEHQFLTYSAKYWDKHLDCHHGERPLDSECEDFSELRDRVMAFLNSPNFQTCIQVQSLWVDSHFGIYAVTNAPGRRLKRVLPDWQSIIVYKIDYHSFWYEWKELLHSGTSSSLISVIDPYKGEIDRCWWAALGRRNFLSKMNSRYISFRFESDEDYDFRPANRFEGVSAAGDELKILRLNSRCDDDLQIECECERWKLSSDGPTLQGKQKLIVQKTSANWLQYVQCVNEDSNPGSLIPRRDRAPFVAFHQNCQSLRIGAQIYTQNDNGEYEAVPMLPNRQLEGQAPYVEEFTIRGHFIVLATRRGAIEDPKLQDVEVAEAAATTPGSDLTKERRPNSTPLSRGRSTESRDKQSNDSGSDTSDEASSDLDDNEGNSETSYDADDDAYESWSECSSADSENSQSEGEMLPQSQDAGSDGDEDDASHCESSEDEDVEGTDSEPDVDPRAFGYGQLRIYGDEYGEDLSDDEAYCNISRHERKRKLNDSSSQEPFASISVFDTRHPVPEKIFHFSRKLPHMLYDSPPVMHPSQSLVVWPLGGGNILFADFEGNTFFIRKLRTSTLHTRQIFVKCCFSACGRFLHMATLEGQHQSVPRGRRNKDRVDPMMKLALLVSTHRLCNSQPCRSPPSLIYHTRVALKPVSSLQVSKPPFTLTWTPRELYFTCRDVMLQAYQISLFNSDTMESISSVMEPRETMLLPDTAKLKRDVYYFPPTNTSKMARIILGSHSSSPLFSSPPVGCFVHDQNDLGGWVKSSDRAEISGNRGVAQLERPLEKFDPDEDCDLEEFLFLG